MISPTSVDDVVISADDVASSVDGVAISVDVASSIDDTMLPFLQPHNALSSQDTELQLSRCRQ